MHPTRVFPVIAAVVAVIAAGLIGPAAAHAGAGGGGGGGAVCDGFAEGAEVSMLDSCFAGTAQLVDPGVDVLTVRNQGQLPHTYTATDGSFDLRLQPGETGTIDLPDALVSTVYCTLHGTSGGQGMAGVVIRAADSDVIGTSAGARVGSDRAATALEVDAAGTSADDGGRDALAVVALVVASVAVLLSLTATASVVRSRRQVDAEA